MRNKLICPNCENPIIKSYGEEIKMRTKLIVWKKSGMFAICKSCGCEVSVDPFILKDIASNFVYEVKKD
jgi:RNase P subunit RPR2